MRNLVMQHVPFQVYVGEESVVAREEFEEVVEVEEAQVLESEVMAEYELVVRWEALVVGLVE